MRVGVLIGDGFNAEEVAGTIKELKKYGTWVVIVSEMLGTVTASNGTTLKVDESFITTSPYLLDSLYVVGGESANQSNFDYNMAEYIHVAYQKYKPIGVALTAHSYIPKTPNMNMAGVVFASNNSDFEQEFLQAITHQRFWDRT